MLGEVSPVAFSFFGVAVYWYAVIIVSGIILAVFLSSKEAVKVGMQEDDITDFMLWALPSAIVGARLYYVIFQWQDYVEHPIEIFFIRSGGLAIYGGLIGGGLALILFTRRRFISTWKFFDVIAPSVILGQAIGRWGNFMNHEAYGPDTTKEFLMSLHLPNFIIENMKIDGIYRQPTFLYESVWNIIGFFLLILLRRRKNFLKEGEVFLLYIIWYACGRFFIEGMRMDSLYLFGSVRISQFLSVILFVGAIVLMIIRRKKTNIPFYNRINKSV